MSAIVGPDQIESQTPLLAKATSNGSWKNGTPTFKGKGEKVTYSSLQEYGGAKMLSTPVDTHALVSESNIRQLGLCDL